MSMIKSYQEELQALMDEWVPTQEMRDFNTMRKQAKTCETCNGRGYRMYKQDGKLVGEKAGCYNCRGVGYTND